ncbi:MAG: hypothetical protein Q9195_005957 [Heterodermia aff. obscurata]
MASSIVLKAGNLASHHATKLSDFSVVASYNWLDERQPTILVPGMPPIWSPPRISPWLRPDTGTRYIDQNKDRMPTSPFEPLFAAIRTQRPRYDFSAIDIMTDRRVIRQLYDFINGDQQRFKFGIELIGNTLILTRGEPQSRDTTPRNRFVGYRHSFEEAYTKLHPVAQGSTSHHRIITYTLGGLQFLVRSAVDGYRPSAAGTFSKIALKQNIGPNKFSKNIKNLSLNKALPSTSTRFASNKLLVHQGGFEIPQAAVFELSTHSKMIGSIQDSKQVNLYFSQIPCFMEAYFLNGTRTKDLAQQKARFEHVRVRDVVQSSQRWEKEHQAELSRLVDLLKQIFSAARDLGGRASVSVTGGLELRIEGAKDRPGRTLPEKFRYLFLPKVTE